MYVLFLSLYTREEVYDSIWSTQDGFIGSRYVIGLGCASMFCIWEKTSLGHIHDHIMIDVHLCLVVHCFYMKSQKGESVSPDALCLCWLPVYKLLSLFISLSVSIFHCVRLVTFDL